MSKPLASGHQLIATRTSISLCLEPFRTGQVPLLLLPASGAAGNPGDIGLGDLVSSSVARHELSASEASSADLQQGKTIMPPSRQLSFLHCLTALPGDHRGTLSVPFLCRALLMKCCLRKLLLLEGPCIRQTLQKAWA